MSEDIAIPAIAMSIPIVVVPTALFFKHLGRMRELKHIERLKEIEFGAAHPAKVPLMWPSLAALGIGAGVPFFAILFAFLSSMTHHGDHEAIWMPAMMVGVAGVISGSCLGVKMLGFRSSTPALKAEDGLYSKPELDPDAYDTVGRRG